MKPKMFDTPVLPRLAVILTEVASGDLIIPAFQRPFVWDNERRLNLLDSIERGLPIGSLLVWRTTHRDLNYYPELGGIPLTRPSQQGDKVTYLIDGHQRLTTLFGALSPRPRNSKPSKRWPLYYELGTSDRPAFHKPPRGEVPDHWLPLDILLDDDLLHDFLMKLRDNGQGPLVKAARRLSNLFRDYIIPLVPLVTDDLDTVTDAFVRINSQGKKMSEAHMLRALTHQKPIDTEQGFGRLRSALSVYGWTELDEQAIVNCLKAMFGFNVYGSSVLEVHQKLKNVPNALETLTKNMQCAVEFLQSVGVRGKGSLPYVYQLVTLSALADRLDPWPQDDQRLRLLKVWFWQTTYEGHFTGITGNRIRDGIRDLIQKLREPASRQRLQTSAIKPLRRYHASSVRSKAYLLFLAQLPKKIDASIGRQERLAPGGSDAAPKLFHTQATDDPANHVIADQLELVQLRKALKAGSVTPEMADEWALPVHALPFSSDEVRFLDLRREWLSGKEQEFIRSWGLELEHNTEDGLTDDEDDCETVK